jgi:hypothetical protein
MEYDDFFTIDILSVDMLTGVWIGAPLVIALEKGYQYYDDNAGGSLPYRLVLNICGDCTNLGSNTVLDFWED